MKMFERTISYDCDTHNVHKKAVIRAEERKRATEKFKGVFCLDSAMESWQFELEREFGCTDWKRTLSPITKVEHELG